MNLTERAIGSHDLVIWATDDPTGLQAAVALHTPAEIAVGQLVHDPGRDPTEAVLEALRRSERMTMRAALLRVPVGGAAAVLVGQAPRGPVLEAFGRVLERLEGRLWVTPGPGTSPEDLRITARTCGHVAGAGDGAHLLPAESRGAVAAARAAWCHVSGGAGISDARILVLGAGRMGAGAARMLAGQDALVMIADPDPARAALLAAEVDGVAIPTDEALTTECDVLVPCADGLALRAEDVETLRCRVLAGPADGQLAGPEVGAALAACGVVWVPELLAGAGGLLSAAREMGVGDLRGDADADTTRIADVTVAVLDDAADLDTQAALERIAGPPAVPDRPTRVRAIRAA